MTPTFPWLGPLGALPLPAKWSVHFGSPILAHPEEPGPLRDELLVSRMTEELRAQIQALVDEDLHRREGVFA